MSEGLSWMIERITILQAVANRGVSPMVIPGDIALQPALIRGDRRLSLAGIQRKDSARRKSGRRKKIFFQGWMDRYVDSVKEHADGK
jgi:hypothetical protein